MSASCCRKASFYALYERRHEPGNGERIDQALHAIRRSQWHQTERRQEKRVPGIFRFAPIALVKKTEEHHPASAAGRLCG